MSKWAAVKTESLTCCVYDPTFKYSDLKKFLDSRKVRMLLHKIKRVYLHLNSAGSLSNVLVKVNI